MMEEQSPVTDRRRIIAVSISTADSGYLIAGSVAA